MTAELTNSNTKMNFVLSVYKFPATYDLDPSVKTRRENRLSLGPRMTSMEIQVATGYYIILNTQNEIEGDFALSYWYDDKAVNPCRSSVGWYQEMEHSYPASDL